MLAEIIGVAGCGKTTLTKTLVSQQSGVPVTMAPTLDGRRSVVTLLRTALRHIVPVLRHSRRGFLWHNLRMIMHINGMLEQLSGAASDGVRIYDQGLIYNLASFCNQGFHSGPDYLSRVREDTLARIFTVVDAVIYLQVDRQTSFDRVMGRDRSHYLKSADSAARERFMDFYIGYYESAVLQARAAGVPVLVVDAKQATPAEVHQQVAAFLEEQATATAS